jgi:hypothetical protein
MDVKLCVLLREERRLRVFENGAEEITWTHERQSGGRLGKTA